MSFERLVGPVRSGKLGMPASMRLKGKVRPQCVIGLTAAFVAEAQLDPKGAYVVLVGTGDNAGQVRIEEATDGGFRPTPARGGSLTFKLGHVALLGSVEHAKQPTHARVIATGSIEIDVPQWPVVQDDDESAENAAQSQRTPAKPAVVKPPATHAQPPTQVNGDDRHVLACGVTVSTDKGSESVAFKGKSAEVSANGARLVFMLCRVLGETVGRKHLLEKLYGESGADADRRLSTLTSDLIMPMAKIGLTLRVIRGVGLQLAEAK